MDLEEGWRVRCLDDEPIYCKAPHDETEVLYAGSDDEHYDNPEERKSRYENAAVRFLQGHTPVLLTTVLRGPFEGPDAKGWVNPWQSRRKTAPVASAKKAAPGHLLEITSDPEPEIIETQTGGSPTSCHLPSPRSLDQVDITPHPFMEEEDLQRVESWRSTAESASRTEEPAWSFDASLSQSQHRSQRKRRPAGSEWLKRDDNKRRKAGRVHDLEQPSVKPQRKTPSLHREPSGPRTPSRQKQQDTVVAAEAGRKSLESPEASSSSPYKASLAATARSSQRLSSQTCDKRHSSPEKPAPLSTPFQTPESSRKPTTTPGKATIESRPRSSGADIIKQETRGGDEFETQQDESFLFRARPRTHAPGIMQLSPTPRISVGRVSSLASTASSETGSHAELLDLDGDTCMADDTKATIPESIAKSNEHHRGSPKENMGLVVEQATEGEVGNDRPQSEHSSGKSATGYTEDTLVATNHTPIRGLKQPELTQPSPTKQDVAEVRTEESDQGSTIVAHSVSQEEQNNEPINDVGRTLLPPTPTSRLPMATQPAPPPSISQHGTMSQTFPQSPWSKPSQFTVSSSICRSDEGQQHLGSVEASISGGAPTHDPPTTPLTAEVEREPASGCMYLNPQSEAGTSCIRDNSRIEKIIGEGDSPAIPASQQSPWKADVPAMALPQQQQLPLEDGHGNFVDPSCQSPWTASPERIRQTAQAALLCNVFAAATPVSPSPLAPPVSVDSDALVADRAPDTQHAAAVADIASPSSPGPTLCIKSFAKFMSPSPEKPHRRSKKIRLSDGHLPSTQNLIAATTDNPWGNSPRPCKRVRWAPMPDENDSGEDRCPQTPTGPRASSPPPETAAADVSTGDDDQCLKVFQNHFKAVSRRRKLHHHLLPSASQQFLESPAPMAMAEAFVAADSLRAPPAPEATTCRGETPLAANAETQESASDDVADILRDVNEFIGMFDIEADLARTKEEEQKATERRQRQQQQQSQGLGGGFSSGLNFERMMDAGVWD
ncbi:protamine P1 [Colletotrichum graminicola]|uniref:Protamine P1 n=1 Tax=Colletotrichum graminicola (strain M1.001 / M2 / FGSC 10212) TaxID=645133 RepID=E3QW68_COLGM|nr:protamine P1 [Colletotrichum graminicola M1.001]EFQ35102.1 protamine P1 [Colletotrichum graminicola M1.001]WDK10509.1 protamine P1 [Colletotrichum graminicola]